MGGPTKDHDIALTATVTGSRVKIDGNGAAELERGSGAHRFRFTLDDQTGLNVQFSSLDAEDNSSRCPPAPGENSSQIVAVRPNGDTASFTDNNNNNGNNGPMNVSYQWNFTCNDPTKQVESFDPIIINGGN